MGFELGKSVGGVRQFTPVLDSIKEDTSSLEVLNGSADSGGFRDVGIANGSWRLVYPHEDRATAEQVAGVSLWLSSLEDIVTGADTATSVFALVDLESAVDFVLLEEFAKNSDAYYLSMHVWKDVGGKLRFSPWDIDLSFGQPNYNNSESPEEWILYRPALIRAMAREPVSRWAVAVTVVFVSTRSVSGLVISSPCGTASPLQPTK